MKNDSRMLPMADHSFQWIIYDGINSSCIALLASSTLFHTHIASGTLTHTQPLSLQKKQTCKQTHSAQRMGY